MQLQITLPPMKKKLILTAILSLTLIGLTGCNTISGAGKDISAAGEGVTNAAESVKKDL